MVIAVLVGLSFCFFLCVQPFVLHMLSCEKPISGREIIILQETSTWGNQISLIPYSDYNNQLSCLHDRRSFPKKADCNLVQLFKCWALIVNCKLI